MADRVSTTSRLTLEGKGIIIPLKKYLHNDGLERSIKMTQEIIREARRARERYGEPGAYIKSP